MPRKKKPKQTARSAPARPRATAGPAFKAFYMKLVPAAMRYATRNTDFFTAQLVTQELAWTFWRSGVEGAEAADTLTEPPAPVLEAMIRAEIVAEWRRTRQPTKKPLVHRGDQTAAAHVVTLARYFQITLPAKEEAAFESRLERDGEFFELVAPIVMQWRKPRGATPERVRDYRMPERGVELMWAEFSEGSAPG
jgi:hypothetical protein